MLPVAGANGGNEDDWAEGGGKIGKVGWAGRLSGAVGAVGEVFEEMRAQVGLGLRKYGVAGRRANGRVLFHEECGGGWLGQR